MANKKHVQVLVNALASMSMRGWNQWRMENPDLRPDLSGEELNQVDLSFINLRNSDLSYADFSGTNLHHANLQKADLTGSKFRNADLSHADLSFACLRNADLKAAALRQAVLRGANLQGADLEEADLKRADLTDALIDHDISSLTKNWFSSGVNRLEKIALGLLRRGFGHKEARAGESMGAKTDSPPPTKNL
jgi:uncharacterized protein YjbI with pentapeptide repeats